MSNAPLEYVVLFDCTGWLMDVPVQTWNELPCPSGLDGSGEKKYGAWSRTLTSAQRGHRSTVSVDLSLLPDFGTVFALNTERYDVHKPTLTHCDFEVNRVSAPDIL